MSKKKAIEEKYRPIFARYANESIPLDRIRVELNVDDALASGENGGALLASKDLPPHVRARLRDLADSNGDGYLSYTEFLRMVDALPFGRKLLRFAVTGIVPGQPKSTKRKIVRNEYLKVVDETPTIDSYVEQFRCCPPPFFIILITLIEVGVFIYYYFDMQAKKLPVDLKSKSAPLYSPLIWDPYRRQEAWRYVSYIFLHSGLYHLISNVLSQLILGIPLEMVHGFWRVGLVYLLGAGLGALAHSLTDFKIWMCGASGGVYALIGAQLANTILNWDQMNYKWLSGSCLRFILSAPMRILFWVIYCGADVGYTIYMKVTLGESYNVAISAHIGGLICGLLIGLPILRNLSIKTWERILEVISLVVFILLVGGAVAFNILYTGMPPLNWDSLSVYSEAIITKTRAFQG